MIDYRHLLEWIETSKLAAWSDTLPQQIAAGLSTQRYGDLPGWYQALNNLPQTRAETFDFTHEVLIGDAFEITAEIKDSIETQLRALIPWRKGPYTIFGIELDTEWRSDWKWDRVRPHISSLKDKLVLDVGCGNGYH